MSTSVADGRRAPTHERGLDMIVLAGISTDMGVETTARSGATRGYNVVVDEMRFPSMKFTAKPLKGTCT